jgi:hypothetical protein
MNNKFCYKCNQNKPLESFGKNKSKKDGLSTECKPCKKLQDRSYYKNNIEQVKQSAKQYRELNPEKVSQAKRNCYLKDKEKYKNMKNAWRKANPEKIYEYQKAYKQSNLGKANSWLAEYRASKLQATPSWYEEKLIKTVYTKAKEWGFAVDHIVPLKGETVCGLHCWSNLQLLDPMLNSEKGNRYWPDMP